MIFLDLFLTFFKIGAFTFGGGYAMLPLIQSEVTNNNWISTSELINFIAISESTPGPFAINLATFIGSNLAGIIGAVCSTLGVILPSFIIIIIVAEFFEKFKTNKIISYCMNGLRPATIGLIAASVLSIGKTVFFENGFSIAIFQNVEFYISFAVFSLMTILAFKKIHPIFIILLSAIIGIATGYLL